MHFLNSGKQKKGRGGPAARIKCKEFILEKLKRGLQNSHVMILAISVAACKLHILLELRDNISDA